MVSRTARLADWPCQRFPAAAHLVGREPTTRGAAGMDSRYQGATTDRVSNSWTGATCPATLRA